MIEVFHKNCILPDQFVAPSRLRIVRLPRNRENRASLLAAKDAVIRDPLFSPASTTSVALEMPEMIRLRIGNE